MSAPKHRALDFLPATREISIGRGVVYRPIRSWHSGTYAGERITNVHGDRSGCVTNVPGSLTQHCPPPYTVTHRVYWNKRDPERTVSAFLSYPNGMGCCPDYFWEAMGSDEPERFPSEEECETRILEWLSDKDVQS